MRTAPCLVAAALALVACSKTDPPRADASTAPAAAATFAKAAPVVGAKRTESSELSLTLAMTVDGKKSDTKVVEIVRHTDEILAVSGEAVSKVRVTFDEVSSTQQPASAIKGKTYVVEAKDGRIDVRDANDKPAPPSEAREVEKQFKNLGKPDPMLGALPTGGVMPGQKVDSIAQAITEQLKDSGEAIAVKDVVVTFRETRGDEGVFVVLLTMTKNEGTMTMQVALKGEAGVSTKTGASTKLHLAGPVTIGGGATVKADGSGEMLMKTETKSL